MAPLKRKRVEITLKQKCEILQQIEAGNSQKQVAEQFDIGTSTVSDIVKNRTKILSKLSNGDYNVKRTRDRTTALADVDKALVEWFRTIRNNNLNIQSIELLEQAKEFCKLLGHEDAEISMSWINRWKDRHMIRSVKVCGEGGSVQPTQFQEWHNVHLPFILKQYSPDDIFNADELGLFWRMMPEHTLAFKGDKCTGGKVSKERITVLLCANMSGNHKLLPLVIGKSKTPRCFRSAKHVPIDWKWNKKAWMTSTLFREFVLSMNSKMSNLKRHVALVIDNCSAHPKMEPLTNVTVFYLPPNTTSHTQPLDAGIIHNFKTMYRSRLIRKRLLAFKDNNLFSVDILTCLHMVRDCWDSVTKETIANCFRKTGFTNQQEISSLQTEEMILSIDENDRQVWNMLKEAAELPEKATFEDYVKMDDDLIVADAPSKENIVKEMTAPIVCSESTEDEGSEISEECIPTIHEGLQMLKKVRLLLLNLQEGPTCSDFTALTGMEKMLETCALKKMQQTKITNFLSKH